MLNQSLQTDLYSIVKQAIIQANMFEITIFLVVVSENIFYLSEIEDEKALFNYSICLDLYETITDRNIGEKMD